MKNKSGKDQMTIENEISSKEVKIGLNLISQTTVKKTLDVDIFKIAFLRVIVTSSKIAVPIKNGYSS